MVSDEAVVMRFLAVCLFAACSAFAQTYLTPGLPTPGSEALRRLYADGARWLDEG